MTLNTEKMRNEEGNLLPVDLLPLTSYLLPATCYLGVLCGGSSCMHQTLGSAS